VLVAGLGAALFGVSALLLKTGTLGWDESLFRIFNQVPPGAAAVLTPVSRLFSPVGITVVVVLAVVYVVGPDPGRAAGGGWGRGGRPGLGAGARGQGHCRPPPAL
jgi:hypothetical protein